MFCRHVFGNISSGFRGISRDFAEIPEFRMSATARNIRSPAELTLNTKTNHVKSNRRDVDLHGWLQAVQGGMD